MSPFKRVLVVDDEQVARESLGAWLREDGYAVDLAGSGADAIALAREREYALALIDLRMPPGPDGIETMRALKALRPEVPAVIVTAFASIDTAIDAMKEGAEDYLVKPVNPREISLLVERLISLTRLRRENRYLRRRLTRQRTFHELTGRSAEMQALFALIRDVASLRSTVLILGESGSGKELVARAIHAEGERRVRRFVAVSCAALPETLLESELFGHERGAFTGAGNRKLGKVELAAGGTLFLDEIGDIPPRVQQGLLRVLQERSFFRVGGTEEISVDVRFIAATNRDLEEAVRAGEFREDLFYRLDVITVRVPPLRQRREDIPLLAADLVARLAEEMKKPIERLSDGALQMLLDYDWPGNVRELENALERAMVGCRGDTLTESDLAFVRDFARRDREWEPPAEASLTEIERKAIEAALRRTAGNVRQAARQLGIDRSTLYDKMKRYGLSR
ncbi:MAG: sigma-54 dependent transcriptional regulator [Acidobacteria bacterium]|nr:sigma-54 dependent transcriptional regulator [Acidobacteriota bacterium]